MRKFTILTLALSFIFLYAQAQYTTPANGVKWTLDSLVNNSNGAVTFENDVYTVSDSLKISATDTLSITENAVVNLDRNILLEIRGVLQVLPPDSVKFTATDTTQRWLGMRFDTSSASVLKRAIIEYGGGIRIFSSDMLIDSSIIRYNNRAYASGAINPSRSKVTISNNVIHNNARSAIITAANIPSSPIVINNLIYSNATENGNYPQINLTVSPEDTILVRGNTVTGMYPMSGGISIANLIGGSVKYCIIEDNIIRNNRYGIAILGGDINGYINNNIIENNNIQNNPIQGGSGINFLSSGPNQNTVVARNTISGNLWGITIQNQATPTFGFIEGDDTLNVGMNRIFDNGNGGEIYNLYNNTPNHIMAQNNFWGSDDSLEVENTIYHKNDSSTLGLVTYMPLMTVTSSKILQVQQQTINVYPNPATTFVNFNIDLADKNTDVTIIIFDKLGREVKRVKGNTNQQLSWNTSHVSPGVYYYKAHNYSFIKTGTIIVQ